MASTALGTVRIASPNGKLDAVVFADGAGKLGYIVIMNGKTTVIGPSRLGVIVDGKDTGDAVMFGRAIRSTHYEEYPWLGFAIRGRNQPVRTLTERKSIT